MCGIAVWYMKYTPYLRSLASQHIVVIFLGIESENVFIPKAAS